jgi:hypothetical protein
LCVALANFATKYFLVYDGNTLRSNTLLSLP